MFRWTKCLFVGGVKRIPTRYCLSFSTSPIGWKSATPAPPNRFVEGWRKS